MGVNKGPWTDQENQRLKTFVAQGVSIIRAAAVFNRTKKPRDERGNCALTSRGRTYRFVGVVFATKSPNGL